MIKADDGLVWPASETKLGGLGGGKGLRGGMPLTRGGATFWPHHPPSPGVPYKFHKIYQHGRGRMCEKQAPILGVEALRG